MKKFLLSVIIVCSFVTSKGQFTGAVIDSVTHNSERDEVNRNIFAIDNAGTLHLVYMRAIPSGGWMIFYKKRILNDVWSAEDTVAAEGFSPSLAVDRRNGNAYVAYENADTAGHKIMLANNSGGMWAAQTVSTDTTGDSSPVIAADTSGYLHIAWIGIDSAGDYKIIYATNISGTWAQQLLQASQLGPFGGGAAPQIAVDASGIAHIAYRGGNFGTYRIYYTENASAGGAVWTNQIITTPNGEDLSSAIETGGDTIVHLLVSGDDGFGFPSKTYYLSKSPSVQLFGATQLVDSLHNAVVGDLFIDANDTPHCVLNEISGNILTGNIIYAEPSNQWLGSVVLTNNDAYSANLVIDAEGHGYIAAFQGNSFPDEEVIVYGYQYPLNSIGAIENKNELFYTYQKNAMLVVKLKKDFNGMVKINTAGGNLIFSEAGRYDAGEEIIFPVNIAKGIYVVSLQNKTEAVSDKILLR